MNKFKLGDRVACHLNFYPVILPNWKRQQGTIVQINQGYMGFGPPTIRYYVKWDDDGTNNDHLGQSLQLVMEPNAIMKDIL